MLPVKGMSDTETCLALLPLPSSCKKIFNYVVVCMRLPFPLLLGTDITRNIPLSQYNRRLPLSVHEQLKILKKI